MLSSISALLMISCLSLGAEPTVEEMHAAFAAPPADCKPHTRWWWMGNALREEDIVRQLDQMRGQGIGGVEQVSMEPVYEKGNHEYLSPEYFALLRFAVEQAAARGMEFSVNFGGPGWIWGGEWVPKEDQSGVMLSSALTLEGPRSFSGPLSEEATPNPNDLPRSTPVIGPEDALLKVVAGRLENGRLVPDSLVELPTPQTGRELQWRVPKGQWRVMAFWRTQRDNANAVDHLNKAAMTRYCETLGARYTAAIGDHYGKTVESFFSDSFEVPIQRNGLYWTDGLFGVFQKEYGYDLVPLLPALWWDVGGISPKVRYDVNEFLHRRGMDAFFNTFLGWCEKHGVRGRIQPYGFVTDIMEGAGAAHLPEMEITAGEKDAVPWFDTRIGPREYTASGAHLYGRGVVSAEAFTYLHWEPYRETLSELKIATDGYLRAGANKLYNHGIIASPETGILPVRGFFAALRVSPENIWWPHYHHLAEYTAHCCALLRQGVFTADVAVYSPLANQWTQSVLNARKWTREFEWGGLGRLFAANGYGFDIVNDDVLQNHCAMDGDRLRLGAMTYRALILPDIAAMPAGSLRRVADYVRQGGTVIALERVPEASTGMRDHEAGDAEVRRISGELFEAPSGANDPIPRSVGKGRTYSLADVMRREDPLDFHSAPFDPFLKALRATVPPDLDIDLVRAGKRENGGLTFLHRRAAAADIYFVANIQEVPFHDTAGFRMEKGVPWAWDPRTGERNRIHAYNQKDGYMRMSLSLAPYESRFIVFEHTDSAKEPPRMLWSDFLEVIVAGTDQFTALAARNGAHGYHYFDGASPRTGVETVSGLSAVFEVGGVWEVRFDGEGALGRDHYLRTGESWTDLPELRHFSGTARYTINFDLPEEYCSDTAQLRLSLGRVCNVAEIVLNGRPVGVHWMDGQEFAIEGLVRPGKNRLEVAVTNTLINRISGMDSFPGVPEALRPHFGGSAVRSSAEAKRLLGFEPLPPSGLLGPVRVTPLRVVTVNTAKPR